MMSCRALGRGVIDALLTWICLTALAAGAARVALPCVINQRNVPLRIALTGAGFRTSSQPGHGQAAEYVRDLSMPLLGLPSWVVSLMADLSQPDRRAEAAARRTDGRRRAARRSA